MLYAPEVDDGVRTRGTYPQDTLEHGAAGTEDVPVSPELLLVITDQRNICKVSGCFDVNQQILKIFWKTR